MRPLPRHLQRRGGGARGLSRGLPQPAGERRCRNRGRHGDLDPAAQCRRADRRRDPTDRQRGSEHRRATGACPGPRLPDRRRLRREQGVDPSILRNRARQLPPARPLERGAAEGRRLHHRRRPDALPGPEVEADRGHRAAHQRQEAADPRGRARRERRGYPPGAGAALAQRRPQGADGEPVQAHRPGDALSPEPQRPRQDTDAARHVLEGRAARLPRPPGRGADRALALPARQDRGPARAARGLPQSLSQPRRGDPHHPRGGRAQGRAHPHLRADRSAGGGDPQHASAFAAPAGGDGDRPREQGADARGGEPARPARQPKEAQRAREVRPCLAPRPLRPRHAAWEPSHDLRRAARLPSTSRWRRWSSASRSP